MVLSDNNPKPLCMSQLLYRVSLLIVTCIYGREQLVAMLGGFMAFSKCWVGDRAAPAINAQGPLCTSGRQREQLHQWTSACTGHGLLVCMLSSD